MADKEVSTDKQCLEEALTYFNFKYDISDLQLYGTSSTAFGKL